MRKHGAGPGEDHGGAATRWPWHPEAPPVLPSHPQVTPAPSSPFSTRRGGSGARPWAAGTHGVALWVPGGAVARCRWKSQSGANTAGLPAACTQPAAARPETVVGARSCPGWGAPGSLARRPRVSPPQPPGI